MYIVYKISSFILFVIFIISLVYFIYLLIQGKSETIRQIIFLICIFMSVIFFFIGFLLMGREAESIYKQEEIIHGRVFEKCGVFVGMRDGTFVKNSAPKDSYADFIFDDNSFYQASDYSVRQKSKLLKKGDRVCVKYIKDSGIFSKNINVINVEKLS